MSARTRAAGALTVLALAVAGCAQISDALEEVSTEPRTPVKGRLADLAVARVHDDGSYERDAFGTGWLDLDGDGCDTRDEVMQRDLTRTRTKPDGCGVATGRLDDPYGGGRIDYVADDYWTVHVDHIYPLAHAWRLGAYQWSTAKREAFANDPANLLAVDGGINSSKGDSGPGEWVPANRAFACTYARKYVRVAATYDLPVTRADRDALARLLGTCERAS